MNKLQKKVKREVEKNIAIRKIIIFYFIEYYSVKLEAAGKTHT